MSPRLRRTLTGNLVLLVVLVAVGLVFWRDDPQWFLVWAPLALTISVLMDYFVWQEPERVARNEARKEAERHRPPYFSDEELRQRH